MPVLEELIDDETYTALDWISLVGEEGDGSAPWSLTTKFYQRARELDEEGHSLQSKTMQVLGGAISMHLRHPSHAPFGPVFQSSEGRSMSMEDLGQHDVALLARAAHEAPTPWLRARFADLAVTADGRTPPDWRLGRLAVDAYLEYVESVFGTEHAIRGLDELQRSLVLLWVYAKKDPALWERYWTVILDEVPHSIEHNWPGLAFRLCDEAINRNRHACEAILPQIEAKAVALDAVNPQEAARWYAQAYRLNQRLGKPKEANASLMAQGEATCQSAPICLISGSKTKWTNAGLNIAAYSVTSLRRQPPLYETHQAINAALEGRHAAAASGVPAPYAMAWKPGPEASPILD